MDVAMKAMMAELAPVIRDFVSDSMAREVTPLRTENQQLKDRLTALEARQPDKGDQGERGEDGVSPEPEAVAEVLRSQLEDMVTEAIVHAVAELPIPEKGDAGERGTDGLSPDPEDIATAFLPAAQELIAAEVARAIGQLPPPERGEKGETGDCGETGERGADGSDGKDGADGIGMAGALIDRAGHLRIRMTNGTDHDLGPCIGKDGDKGQDGRDGFGFEEMDACVLDDDRTIEFSFRRGEHEKAFTFKWPTMIYRGVWVEGQTYQAGDVVTWGGSAHVAEIETSAKPDTKDCGWRLAVKRGRDGKDAKTTVRE